MIDHATVLWKNVDVVAFWPALLDRHDAVAVLTMAMDAAAIETIARFRNLHHDDLRSAS